MNYLSVENLSKAFGERKLFSNISFGISQGQKIALVGINGAGKSTLMKIIMGLEIPDTGQVALNNAVKIAYVHQNPVFDSNLSIYQTIFDQSNSEVLRVIEEYHKAMLDSERGIDNSDKMAKIFEQMDALQAWDFEYQVKEVLGKLGLHDTDLPVGNLSGGQRKRVALAKAILEKPDLLLLDEPTNHLDLETIEWLEEYLAKANLSIFMVTHDRYFLEKVTNEILELDQGKIHRYQGNYGYFLDKKAERMQIEDIEIEKAKSLYKKELDWIRRQPKARGTKAKYRVDAFEETKEKAFTKREERDIELSVSTQRLGNKILEIEKISKSYGEKKLIEDFSYIFKKKDRIGIVGPNGAGKTTFLKLITGLIEPDQGKITAGQTTLFGYYRQEEDRFDEEKRLIDVVKEVAEVVTLNKGQTITVSQFLTQFGFPPKQQFTPIGKMSGGERRRLQLLLVLIKNPNFLILDEPTNDLDLMTLNILEEFLDTFPGCLIIVSHDRYFMDRLVEHLFVFEGEGVIRDFPGNYTDFREWEKEESTKSQVPSIKTTEARSERLETRKDTKVEETEKSVSKIKASYKQKQEFKKTNEQIAKLEGEKEKITAQIAAGIEDHEDLLKLSNRIAEIDSELEELEMTWLELSELEGIED
ncbi:MAG TPA: ABC transporter [Algoriphagus sp.]|jgi:ATP-binding cassette subfamily F protein uup|uniref:ABC-F family ATP-binding cassette domain-containing protein n=2 Tax=Algoriphagus TaxID=246875 RepID=UPI000C67790E|nr:MULTISPECIES: ABC-F family ATP-binding cassette domain-containing protein [unclassified Algoriphagus]MAL15894.1 ABC transporter [Algoriphagus sp.]MAN87090.1 ABC transporter [Algoriphagus sp.]HCB46256.1 ABC transporter [Algoriphagus sp.]HCD87058.1 ABC transporter [Algoriphagus sp.]HCH44926.1 ABC transporter [Algoriphagus sp.]|tara:strand:- start:1257 stop:3185 length:1929 start_codon:yes stop_codon:yes gene_type:complete